MLKGLHDALSRVWTGHVNPGPPYGASLQPGQHYKQQPQQQYKQRQYEQR